MNKLVAIVGMIGSGKSLASDYYESIGYERIHFGTVTFDRLKSEGLEINPVNEKMMREKIREEYGMAAFAMLALPKIEEALKKNNVVIDGLYSWQEYKVLKEKFECLKVIAMIVNKDVRYERASRRKNRPFNNEEAMLRDISEIENLEKGGPIAFADYYVLNEGDMANSYKKLDEITKLIEEK